jgi:hypothetical protein
VYKTKRKAFTKFTKFGKGNSLSLVKKIDRRSNKKMHTQEKIKVEEGAPEQLLLFL